MGSVAISVSTGLVGAYSSEYTALINFNEDFPGQLGSTNLTLRWWKEGEEEYATNTTIWQSTNPKHKPPEEMNSSLSLFNADTKYYIQIIMLVKEFNEAGNQIGGWTEIGNTTSIETTYPISGELAITAIEGNNVTFVFQGERGDLQIYSVILHISKPNGSVDSYHSCSSGYVGGCNAIFDAGFTMTFNPGTGLGNGEAWVNVWPWKAPYFNTERVYFNLSPQSASFSSSTTSNASFSVGSAGIKTVSAQKSSVYAKTMLKGELL